MKKELVDAMTLQEAMDYAVQKVVRQGRRCFSSIEDDELPACMYGDTEGNHCVVGWLLDHSNYDLMTFEGAVSSLLSSRHAEEVPKIIYDNIDAFTELQVAHDTDLVATAYETIRLLSKRHGIDTSGQWWKDFPHINRSK